MKIKYTAKSLNKSEIINLMAIIRITGNKTLETVNKKKRYINVKRLWEGRKKT